MLDFPSNRTPGDDGDARRVHTVLQGGVPQTARAPDGGTAVHSISCDLNRPNVPQ